MSKKKTGQSLVWSAKPNSFLGFESLAHVCFIDKLIVRYQSFLSVIYIRTPTMYRTVGLYKLFYFIHK